MPLVVRETDVPPGSDDRVPDPITTREQAEQYLAVVADAYGMAEAPVPLQEAIFFTPASSDSPNLTTYQCLMT